MDEADLKPRAFAASRACTPREPDLQVLAGSNSVGHESPVISITQTYVHPDSLSAQSARLAERLISSLEQASDSDAEKLWLEEAGRRLDELESGKVAGVPAKAVSKRARSTLR